MLLGLLAVALGFAVSGAAEPDSPITVVDAGAAAVLVVDGVDYEFELDTCFVGEDSFVVAGHGTSNNEDFRVLASPSEVELAFGVIDESAPVPDDSRWYGTQDAVSWSSSQSSVTARLKLIERLDESEVAHEAELNINCATVS